MTPEERITEFLRQHARRAGADPEDLYTLATDPNAEPVTLRASDLRAVLAEAEQLRTRHETLRANYRLELERNDMVMRNNVDLGCEIIATQTDRDRARDAAVALQQQFATEFERAAAEVESLSVGDGSGDRANGLVAYFRRRAREERDALSARGESS